jgi:hypothetical protein
MFLSALAERENKNSNEELVAMPHFIEKLRWVLLANLLSATSKILKISKYSRIQNIG